MSRKSPREAARRAEERAKQAQAQYGTGGHKTVSFSSEEVLAALNDNEAGDARLLKAVMKDCFVLDAKRKLFFRFENGYWKKDLENESLAFAGCLLRETYGKEAIRQYAIATDPGTDEEAKKTALQMHSLLHRRMDRVNSLHRMENTLKLAATGLKGLVITGDEWNANPWSIQAQDTVIDLKTGASRSGLPRDYINKAAPTKWNGLDEPAETWAAFMASVFDGDESLVNYVQRVLGAALVGKPSQQEFYIFWGEGRNGKGTMLETLKEILGEGLAGPIRSEMVMDSKQAGNNGPNPELLDLQGKRIVWASETKDGQRLNAEKVKLFTGGDTLSSRYNYSNDVITFKPTHTLFMLTNNKPRISAGDTAVWDRLRLVPFLMRFVDSPTAANERQKDIELQEKLLNEASGILAWLVRGCLDWLENGLNPPQAVTDSGEEYRMDEDPVQQFVNERCLVGPGYKAQVKPLHDAFSGWFTDSYGVKASVPSLRKFSDRLRRNFNREEGRNVWFHGIALIDDKYN